MPALIAAPMDKEIVDVCKRHINMNDIEGLHLYYKELMDTQFPRTPDWSWIFHKVYLHACLKGNKELANWCQIGIFPLLDPIQQAALRQIFAYGKYLLQRAKAT
jgi:hypothetical protein